MTVCFLGAMWCGVELGERTVPNRQQGNEEYPGIKKVQVNHKHLLKVFIWGKFLLKIMIRY